MLEVMIRPSIEDLPRGSSIKRWAGSLGFIGLGVVGLVRLLISGSAGISITLGLIVAAMMGFLVVVGVPTINHLAATNATVFVAGDVIGMTNLLGQRRNFSRSDLARVVFRSVTSGGVVTAYTFFVSQSGRCLFRVASRQWNQSDIRKVCEVCSVPAVGSWDDVSSRTQVNQEIAGAFSRLSGARPTPGTP